MKFRRIKQGERIIRQGEKGNFFYLILQGTCVLNVEKNNLLYNAGQLGPGDAAGESVLLNDEPQKAHVDAETDTDVLSMSREEYESLSAKNPELRNFLSAVLTRRLGLFEGDRGENNRQIHRYRKDRTGGLQYYL